MLNEEKGYHATTNAINLGYVHDKRRSLMDVQ